MKLIRWDESAAFLGVRPNQAAMICRICSKVMRKGQVYVSVDMVNCHRICVKRFLEWSFGHIPMTPDEVVNVDPNNKLNEIELDLFNKEFDAYVEKIVV